MEWRTKAVCRVKKQKKPVPEVSGEGFWYFCSLSYSSFQSRFSTLFMRYSLLIGLLVFILGCATTPPYESIIKDAAFREQVLANSEGKYVQLSKGFTYFEQANPHSQKGTVVLVHGFSVPSYIWRPTFESLKAKGYHV